MQKEMLERILALLAGQTVDGQKSEIAQIYAALQAQAEMQKKMMEMLQGIQGNQERLDLGLPLHHARRPGNLPEPATGGVGSRRPVATKRSVLGKLFS